MDGGVAVSKQYGINTISSADKKRNTHNPIGDRRKRCGAKLESIDIDFYESLIKFISDHGYRPKVVAHNTEILSFNGLEIVPSKRQLFLHKKEISMTNKEFGILELLARNKGQVFSKEQIYDYVWGEGYFSDSRNIIAYINKIRKKIEPDPANPIYILTIWGIGYKFNEKTK